ncbi:MAG: DUF4339 domain-containing protein [Phycisphaerae bacterium]
MADEDILPPPGGQQAKWFYSIDNKEYGPVSAEQMQAMMRAGQAPPNTMVWRDGFTDWIPAATASELTGGPPPLPSGPTPLERLKVRNAKQNCVTLFAVFLVALVLLLASLLEIMIGPGSPISFGCATWLALGGGVFATIYLPLRWQTLKALAGPYKAMGMIGGLGLVLVLVIVVAAILLESIHAIRI